MTHSSPFRRKPETHGGITIIHLRKFGLKADDMAISVGLGGTISRAYVDDLKQQGYEGTEDIPEESIVSP